MKDAWSPVLTLKSTLISLQSLLCDPQPNDPQDAEGKLDARDVHVPSLTYKKTFCLVAKHYNTSRESFNSTARYWAQAYAGAPPDAPPSGPAATTSNANDNDDDIVVTGQRSRAVDMAGLDQTSVNKFKSMGFPEDQIVSAIYMLYCRSTTSVLNSYLVVRSMCLRE